MKKRLLPLGSVVMLKGGETPLLIYGRAQMAQEDGSVWDYIGCPYPYGHIDANHTYLFNHDQINTLMFIGYQTPAEEKMQKLIVQAKKQKTNGVRTPNVDA